MQDALTCLEVPLAKLRWRCDPASLGFRTTDELTPLAGIIGQERAQKALTLGVEIAKAGYNIYVSGMTGTGKLTAVQQLLAMREGNGTPPDLCYVFHFKSPERPRLLTLPAGQGKALKKVMEGLLTDLKQEIPRVLASESCQQRKKALRQQAKRREQRLMKQFEARLAPQFGLLWHDANLSLAPELAPVVEGKLVSLAELEERLEARRVPLEQYKQLHEQHIALSADFTQVFAEVRRLRHEAQEAIRTLERALVRPIIQQAVTEAAISFPDPAVQQYFQEVEEALNEDIERFQDPGLSGQSQNHTPQNAPPSGYEEDLWQEYQVNIIVDNTETTGAPIVFETSPIFKNLFGTIEPTLEYGGIWRSDFMGIRAGALHRANGGFLIFNALDALSDPTVWPALKRMLRYRQAEIQAYDHLSLVPSTTLKPEPIPCDVKVIMIGDEALYETLASEDESFKRLFKVKADFDTTIPCYPQNIAQYAGFICRICREEQLRPFDCHAVAAIVEFGVRLGGRQNKLSARLDVIADVLREADYWAGKMGAAIVPRAAVEQALQERIERINMPEEKLRELIADGILLMSTQGAVVGQVNGLSVHVLEEDYVFGCPMRITVETSMGDAGVVNIEREVDLSDATHNKGVLILSGYLRHTYAQDKPLVLSASLCIEQSYEGIAGDSASAAEMYALLSSLANLPIDQGIAVTGSVNQKGALQPISAINEKIEGFFDVCRLQGLTGRQGVILPPQNIDDLMLRQDVVDAVTQGQFHLYAVANINEGLPILTGVPAGQYQPGQGYPPDSVNGRVAAQLRCFAEGWYALQQGAARSGTANVPRRAARHRSR